MLCLTFCFSVSSWIFSLFLCLWITCLKFNLFKKTLYVFSGVYGHSTVYHVPTQSFYVFGGYMYGVNRTFISNKLYAFHYPTYTWSVLPIFEEYNPPRMNLVKLLCIFVHCYFIFEFNCFRLQITCYILVFF